MFGGLGGEGAGERGTWLGQQNGGADSERNNRVKSEPFPSAAAVGGRTVCQFREEALGMVLLGPRAFVMFPIPYSSPW